MSTLESTRVEKDTTSGDMMTEEQKRKLELDRLEEITVYQVEIGYTKFTTVDKDAAFKVWQALTESFYFLECFEKNYNEPKFYFRKPLETKLVGQKVQVWKDVKDAERMFKAYVALKARAVKKEVKE